MDTFFESSGLWEDYFCPVFPIMSETVDKAHENLWDIIFVLYLPKFPGWLFQQPVEPWGSRHSSLKCGANDSTVEAEEGMTKELDPTF